MLLAVVPRAQVNQILEALVSAGYTATFSESRGGVMRQAQEMLFIAVDEADVPQVLAIIRNSCRSQEGLGSEAAADPFAPCPHPVSPGPGGAVVFIWHLERIENF